MTELQPSEQDSRYFPNENELAIHIPDCMEYLRYSSRDPARKNKISTTVELFKEVNPKR
jgi:hypothetical protein